MLGHDIEDGMFEGMCRIVITVVMEFSEIGESRGLRDEG